MVADTAEGTIDAKFRMLGRAFENIDAVGPAEKAGLLVGDEVVVVDGASVVELDGRRDDDGDQKKRQPRRNADDQTR